MSDKDTATEYAQELLTLAEAALAAGDSGAPDVVYVATPGPAFDCDQLTVEIRSLGDAPLASSTSTLSGGRKITAAINLIGFRVKIVRCVPTVDDDGNPPDPSLVEAKAAVLNQDAWLIWTRVRTAYKAGELFGGQCDHLFFDGAVAIDESGGLAGWQLDFRAEIEGFANA